MSEKNLIKYLDLNKWENHDDSDYHWQGEIALQTFPRLIAMADENHDNATPLHLDLTVKKNGEIIFWQATTKGTLWQTCQRCLEPVGISLDTERMLALLKNESHVALLDEDVEYLLLEELSKDNKLYLLEMLEDELLVELPLSPKHDDCQMNFSPSAVENTETEEKVNPFSVLAGLKLS